MKRLLLSIVIGALGLFAYQRAQRPIQTVAASEPETEIRFEEQPGQPAVEQDVGSPEFRCDGRVYCSQMSSCEEATFFLQNCPDVKMDGEGDGVPCEKQWCGQR